MARGGRETDRVVEVTTAPRSRREDIAHRQRRYLISMGIRTACFVGAVVVGSGWVRWVLVVASFVLPYVAVVMANAGSSLEAGNPEPAEPDTNRGQLE